MDHQTVGDSGIRTSTRRRSLGQSALTQRTLGQIAPCLLLLLYFALGLSQVVAASITFDEGPHLAVGYTVLRTGDFRLQPIHIHPPLANVIAALPLLLQRDLPDPATVPGWEINSLSAITDAVVWQYPRPQRIAVAGRVPILLVGTLLGALVFRWTRDLRRRVARRGALAGTLALGLYTLDPNLLAHSAVITTDAAATALMVATLYALYRAIGKPVSRQRGRGYLLVVGVFLGLAQLTKVSALMLVPVVAALLGIDAVVSGHRRPGVTTKTLSAALGRFAIVMAAGALTVWAGYGFSVTRPQGWPFAIPAGTHVAIYRSLQEHYHLGHPTYALGQLSNHGWWWYFPLAFVLKTPLPVLLLAVVVPVLRLRRRPGARAMLTTALAVGLFPLGYAATAFFSTVNIGYRHLLPLLPFLYIALALGVSQLDAEANRGRKAGRCIGAALGVWLAIATLHTLPYPLTFFNELAGGLDGGYRYLVDSNLDWGQNLHDLQRWMEDHGETHVFYGHYSPARLDTYGINTTYLPPDPRAEAFAPWNPQPGFYAIGATVLQGPYAPDLNTYAWFRAREPVARLGHALFIYQVLSQAAPGWITLCVGDPAPSTLPALLGLDELRVLQPNCDSANVYAADTAGLYVLPAGAPPPAGGELWLSLRTHAGKTAADVFRVGPELPLPEVLAASGVEGPATFLGHTLDASPVRSGGTVGLVTYWRVDDSPARPPSLMAHLVSAEGTVIAVGDGLGFPVEQWQKGDLIIQRHRFALPPSIPPGTQLTVHAGAYWLDTMERWPTVDGSGSLVLQTLQVEN